MYVASTRVVYPDFQEKGKAKFVPKINSSRAARVSKPPSSRQSTAAPSETASTSHSNHPNFNHEEEEIVTGTESQRVVPPPSPALQHTSMGPPGQPIPFISADATVANKFSSISISRPSKTSSPRKPNPVPVSAILPTRPSAPPSRPQPRDTNNSNDAQGIADVTSIASALLSSGTTTVSSASSILSKAPSSSQSLARPIPVPGASSISISRPRHASPSQRTHPPEASSREQSLPEGSDLMRANPPTVDERQSSLPGEPSLEDTDHGKAEQEPVPRPKRPRKRKAVVEDDEDDAEVSAQSDADFAPPKKKRTRSRKEKPAAEPGNREADEIEGGAPEPKKSRRTRKKKSSAQNIESDATAPTDTEDAGSEASSARKKKKSRSTPKAPRKPRQPRKKTKTPEEIEVEDAEAATKEHDPTQTSMSALVEDLPVGRSTSYRVEKIKKLQESRARDRAIRAQLKEMDKRISLGLPVDPDDENRGRPPVEEPDIPSIDAEAGSNDQNVPASEPNENNWIDQLKDSSFVPQIRMDDSGNAVADELHMEIERDAEINEEDYEHITERETDRFVNSLSHSRKNRGGSRWSKEETALFFHYLSMYGTDFESIARIMTFRTRAEIKRKFNAEDRRDPKLVNAHIFNRKPIDLEEYGRITGKDLSGPPPVIRGAKRFTSEAVNIDEDGENDGNGNGDEDADGAAENEDEDMDGDGGEDPVADEEKVDDVAVPDDSPERSPSPVAPHELFSSSSASVPQKGDQRPVPIAIMRPGY